jgi:lipopolysaccharide export system protein LptC
MPADNSYSRLVAWLKVLLPLTALAILSSLFLVSGGNDADRALPATPGGTTGRPDGQSVGRPAFTATTDTGAALTATADSMHPVADRPAEVTADNLTLRLEARDGRVTTLTAAEGWMDSAAQKVVLGGGVTVTTSGGYRLTAPDMAGSLGGQDLQATGGVAGDSPFGPITAQTMTLLPDPAAPGAHVLDFTGAVRLIYRPGG